LTSKLVTILQSRVLAEKSTKSEFSSEQGVAFGKLHFAAILFAKITLSFCSGSEENPWLTSLHHQQNHHSPPQSSPNSLLNHHRQNAIKKKGLIAVFAT